MGDRKHRIYLDASVVGGPLDDEFANPSEALVQAIERGDAIALVSDILIAEIARAPEPVRAILSRILERPATSDSRLALKP